MTAILSRPQCVKIATESARGLWVTQPTMSSITVNAEIPIRRHSWFDALICLWCHYDDAIVGKIASQITSNTIVYSTVYSDADQRKHQSSASLAFVQGIHRGPVNSPHKWPVTRKMSPFDDVIMPRYCCPAIGYLLKIGSGCLATITVNILMLPYHFVQIAATLLKILWRLIGFCVVSNL